MRRGCSFPVLAGALGSLLAVSGVQAADDLGVIYVESTTIDDRFDRKRDEPSSIGAISGEAVDSSRAENLQQLLQSMPGITSEVSGNDSLKIHIRGVENQVYMGEKPGVAVVIDGVPVFERTGSVNIDLDNIESIKVVKGGASYLFGDDALSGAVIITTKRGAKQAGYRVVAEAGSYGYKKGVVRAGFAGEQANGHVQISRREADGYHDDSAYRADYANGKLQYYLTDDSDLTFGFENAHRLKNSHGSVRGVTAASTDPRSTNWLYNDYANHFDVRLGKYYLTYSKDVDATSNLLVNGYYFADHTRYFSSPIKGTKDDYNNFNDYEQAQRGVKSEYRSGGKSVAWMAGLDLRDNLYDNKSIVVNNKYLYPSKPVGTVSSYNHVGERVHAAYGELKFRLSEPLTLTLNGRFDHIDIDYTDYSTPAKNGGKEFDVASWRFGGNYAARENLDYYANVSTGFRAPDVTQLFVGSNVPTHKVAANPNLRPEHAMNMELGLRTKTDWSGLPVEVDLSVFQIDRTDHIRPTAGQYTTDADNIYDNVGDMRHRGLELSLRSDPARNWAWNVAYTYMDAIYTRYENYNLRTCPNPTDPLTCTPAQWVSTTYDNTGNKIPRVSDHRLNLIVTHRPAPGWSVSGEATAVSSYYADETNLVKIAGHEVYNLLVNYDLRRGGTLWSFFARVDNLLDKQYYNTARGAADSNYDGKFDAEDISVTVNPGRVWKAGLEVKF